MKDINIMELLEYILGNLIIRLLESKENVSIFYDLEVKDSLISSTIQNAKDEEGLQCDKIEERHFYIKLSKKYEKILNNSIEEYKKHLIAKAEEEERIFLNSPQGQIWKQKQEIKQAWQEVREAWKPAKKQINNSLFNIGIFAGTGLRELAKASKPSKKDPFR